MSRGTRLERLVEDHKKYGFTLKVYFFFKKWGIFIADLEDLKYFFTSTNFDKGDMQHEVLEPISLYMIFKINGL